MSGPRSLQRTRTGIIQLDELGNASEALKSRLPPEPVEKAPISRANCPEEAIIIGPEGSV